MRKTKIVCTLGPATDKEGVLRRLIQEGMDVARFNFSHADHSVHAERFRQLCELREEFGLHIAALLDTKGPEIRIGDFKEGKVAIKAGQTFTLTTEQILGDNEKVSITYKDLPRVIRKGAPLLIDDGLVEFKVVSTTTKEVILEAKNDGVLSNHKGINVPGTHLTMPFISKKDEEDILFGAKMGFDFIAASFTRTADDIYAVRKLLRENGYRNINIIAKIENQQGVQNIDEIIEAADGIMIARGDMGVEIPYEEVPVIQKMIIQKVYCAGKQVITATQMLESMIKNQRPTRAEATDIANAIYDGTSAIMLSGETAAGDHPIEALQTMVRIAERTERDIDYIKRFRVYDANKKPDITEAISHATCTTARDLHAKTIVTVTLSGRTARNISKFRPDCTIIGCSPYPHICRQLNMSWGVVPILLKEENNTMDLFEDAVSEVMKAGYLEAGEVTVITAGVPIGVSGTTNLIKVHVVGDDMEFITSPA